MAETLPTPMLFDIPWEDVLFRHVYPQLSLQNLFHVRAVSRCAHECVTQYFQSARKVDLIQVGARFNLAAFRTIVKDNRSIRTFLLRNAKDWLTDAQLVPVLEISIKLRHIDLANCTSVSNTSLQTLCVCCVELQVLNLSNCPWVSSQAVINLSLNCKQLERVDLTGCWDLTDYAIVSLATLCKQLRSLSLSKIYSLTDVSVTCIARNSPQLQTLNLQGCWRVTDDSIRLLGEYCHKLKMLQVRECRDITEISLSRLRVRGIRVDIPQKQYMLNADMQRYLHGLQV